MIRHSLQTLTITLILALSSVLVQAAPSKKVLNIQTWVSSGVPVFFVATRGLPIVDIKVSFNAGSSHDENAHGLSNLTTAMLSEGAGGMDALTISDKFDEVGAVFGSGTSRDNTALSLRSLTTKKWLSQALTNYIQVLSNPSFPEESFALLKSQVINGLRRQQQSPTSLANQKFYEAIYDDSFYSVQPAGTIESVEKLQLKQVKDFYQNYFVAENATIILVGKLTRPEAENIASQIAKSLRHGSKAESLPKLSVKQKMSKHLFYHPTTQTSIRMGQIAIAPNDPNYFSLKLGNHILGASSVSRLFSEIREEKGLSYGAYSYFSPLKAKGPFIVTLETRNEKAHEALTATHAIIADFLRQGPTKTELKEAKQNIIGSFPIALHSNQAILGQVTAIALNNLPIDYLDTYRDNIQKVSRSDIREAFSKTLNLNNFTTVIVTAKNEAEKK